MVGVDVLMLVGKARRPELATRDVSENARQST
jgi:hypothetical protein